MNFGLFIILKKISFSILFLITLQLNSYYAKKQIFYSQEVKYATLTKISSKQILLPYNIDDNYSLQTKTRVVVVNGIETLVFIHNIQPLPKLWPKNLKT